MPRPEGADAGERRLQVTLGLLLVGLIVFTALAFFTPAVGVSVVNLPLDLVINTGATLIAAAVAALAWSRYRETLETHVLFQAAAFGVLASVNGFLLVLVVAGQDATAGFRLDDPGGAPVAAFLAARLVAAILLAAGGYAATRAVRDRPGRPPWQALAPAIATTAVVIGITLADVPLDALLTGDAIDHLRTDPGTPLSLVEVSVPLFGAQLGIGALFLVAAWFAYRRAMADPRPFDAFLAAGLVLAAFSQVHFAVNPGSYVSLVTTGDGLRVAFYTVLLAGIVVQSRTDVRALHVANAELARLRDAEVHHALVEERARLAREVHDGLAQDLWTARLTQGRLVQGLETEAQRRLATDVMDAIDSGIADARQAVMAMRAGADDAPLYEVLQRYLDDFADRFALRATFEASGPRPSLAPRVQAEILRIVQEALNNTRKHADATTVTVRASAQDGRFELLVTDNGKGFEPTTEGKGYGLVSMRERAELLGAALEVRSAHRDGTVVHLALPLEGGQP